MLKAVEMKISSGGYFSLNQSGFVSVSRNFGVCKLFLYLSNFLVNIVDNYIYTNCRAVQQYRAENEDLHQWH